MPAKPKPKKPARPKKLVAPSSRASLEELKAWFAQTLIDQRDARNIHRIGFDGCAFTLSSQDPSGKATKIERGTLAELDPAGVVVRSDVIRDGFFLIEARTRGEIASIIARSDQTSYLMTYLQFQFGNEAALQPARAVLSRAITVCQSKHNVVPLDVTAKWLMETVADHSIAAHRTISYPNSDTHEKSTLEMKGCDFTLTKIETNSAWSEQRTLLYAGTLADLAPNSVQISPVSGADRTVHTVYATTFEGKKRIRVDYSVMKEKPMQSGVHFTINPQDIAERFAKALNHAIVQCRANLPAEKSPF